MDEDQSTVLDYDLAPRFHWRWQEHGIYLGVCTIIGLFVIVISAMPRQTKRPIVPVVVETIHVRYIAASDEPPEKEDPFHDPRVPRRFFKATARTPQQSM